MMLTKQQMQEAAQTLQDGVNYHLAADGNQLMSVDFWSTTYFSVFATGQKLPYKISQVLPILDSASSTMYKDAKERQSIRFMMMHFIALFLSTEEGPIDDEQLNFF